MRRVTAALGTMIVTMMAIGVAAQANFAGKWVMQPPADGGAGGGGRGGRGGGLGQELTITQDASTLTLEYMGGGQNPAPVKLVYKLDGSESKNMVMGRGGQTEQVAKASWAGNVLTVTTTTGFGEQKRTFSLDGGNLVVETTAPGRDGGPGMAVKSVYKKS